MKTQNKSNRSLKNKIRISIVLFILFIGLIIFAGIRNDKSSIQRKLIGFWNIETDNSSWIRNHDYDIGTIIYVESKTNIELPQIFDNIVFEKNLSDEQIKKNKIAFEEMQQNAKGTWKVISTNPDTVFFNVPNNPLHGKYAIRFFIDEKGYSGMDNIYKIELQNDSTYLICNKGGFIFPRDVRDWGTVPHGAKK